MGLQFILIPGSFRVRGAARNQQNHFAAIVMRRSSAACTAATICVTKLEPAEWLHG
jgi:hypothetical protein